MFCCGVMWKSGGEDLQGFYPVRPECQSDVPRTRFKSRAGKTLSARRWHAAFTEDGHLDIVRVLRRIQRGGVHPSIKGAVWEFLVGCYDPNSTFEERNRLRSQRREQYDAWKEECQKMVPVIGSGRLITLSVVSENGQPIEDSSSENQGWLVKTAISDQRVLQWMLSLHQIGLDVVRTDRYLSFYEREDNQARLWDVLAVYTWLNPDIGYVQGMNDICSPMIILLENEADAFWCFERTMRRLRENFRATTTSMGVQTQLGVLSQIIRTVDPRLHQHLEELDGGEYLFAIRMLMVLFRREFSFMDALYLWEMMWAMEYNPNMFASYEEPENRNGNVAETDPKVLKQCGKFERKYMKSGVHSHSDQHSTLAVFVVASVLETKNKRLLKEAKGLDDVVQILGDIAGNLDAKKACREALRIHEKFLRKSKKQ
ncbi:PREDICTED: TBC1 domain family member 15-like isoform X1 [Tarenaya hassleriana]|uniref:TBC1 domain family member 15-like isoform X1 n=2 Tax=Tarenaya hassleriana TaxID=28532 RepID=UPI00053C4EDA|nr:PREDICTED: TBC1 domain family member 15-like isoform X1 [Tarenaya hassleriana]